MFNAFQNCTFICGRGSSGGVPGNRISATSRARQDADNDRDDGGRRCRGLNSEVSVNSAFPQPQVRRSHRGVLRTTLHACIATNKMVDQNFQPPETVEIHTPTYEGTIPGPTFPVEPGESKGASRRRLGGLLIIPRLC
jgi:hypothetical protein